MTTDHVSPESVHQAQGWFEIHSSPTLRLRSEGCPPQCLFTDIGTESIAGEFRHGQTDTVNRNAVADPQRTEPTAPLDQHCGRTPLDPTHRLNKPREHRCSPDRNPWP